MIDIASAACEQANPLLNKNNENSLSTRSPAKTWIKFIKSISRKLGDERKATEK